MTGNKVKKNRKWKIWIICVLIITLTCVVTYQRSEAVRAILVLAKNVVIYGNIFGFTFIKPEQAKKMWGDEPFDAVVFKNQPEQRAAMVYDLIKNHRLMHLTYNELKNHLGPTDGGYYLSEEILTYRVKSIKDSTKTNPTITTYDLVFIASDQAINEIIIWRSQPSS